MSKKMFTQQEMTELRQNPNVLQCSSKSINYSPEFKINAVKQYMQYYSASMIFRQAGFSADIIDGEKARWTVKNWREIYNKRGIKGLKQLDNIIIKKGRPTKKKLTDKEEIEYLHAKVAYLKAENDFLAKLRAARKE